MAKLAQLFWVTLALGTMVMAGCGGCDESALTVDQDEPSCTPEEGCGVGLSCVEGVCIEAGDGGWQPGDDAGDAAIPDADGPCQGQVSCADRCCEPGQVCEENQCVAACAGTRCGEDAQLCCEGSDLCLGDACVTPGGSCARTEECAFDEICEPALGQCLPRDAVSVCEYRPPVGEFNPVAGCSWVPDGLPQPNRGDIVATPLVANLTDDNGDGLTNTDDIPNIVFMSFNRNGQGCCNVPSTLRIVSGECNAEGRLDTIASINQPLLTNDAGMAIADLDNDGVPEILAITMTASNDRPQGTVAFKRVTDDGSEWEVMWHNTQYPTWNVHTRGGAVISVADLDGDGNPEVIIGNVVLNGQTGELLWDGVVTSAGTGGIGNNAFLGPSSTIADINLNGKQEVIAGNTVYDYEGNVMWTYEYTSDNSPCQGQLPCDGYTAVANFDDDPEAEIVIVRRGEIFVLNHDGSLLWKVDVPKRDCARNEAGPPTVADFNGDGRREIGTAGADYYVVAKMECDVDDWQDLGCAERGILWRTEVQDCSSRATASSVFDFEGDGRAEVVYADEVAFRIYDGVTGEVLFEDNEHQSNTRIEMPIIADVNNDGSAQVVVAAAYPNRGDRAGIKVWNDPQNNWVRTRRIWNQHAYHVTNISETGQVPAVPQRNWSNPRLNNYRQNVQPDGLFDAPDLVIRAIDVNEVTCGQDLRLDVSVTVANEGALSVPAGVSVLVEVRQGADVQHTAILATTRRLLPGQSEQLETTWSFSEEFIGSTFSVHATIDPEELINECNEDNNALLRESIVCEVAG